MTDDPTPAPWNPPPMRAAPPETGEAIEARIRLLYGKSLNDHDVAGVAELETEYPRWHIWPHVNFSYPDHQVYYARRNNTQMNILTATGLPAIRRAIDSWIREHTYSWER